MTISPRRRELQDCTNTNSADAISACTPSNIALCESFVQNGYCDITTLESDFMYACCKASCDACPTVKNYEFTPDGPCSTTGTNMDTLFDTVDANFEANKQDQVVVVRDDLTSRGCAHGEVVVLGLVHIHRTFVHEL
eukprot:UN30270